MRFKPILTGLAGLAAGSVLAASGYALADTSIGTLSLGNLSLSPGSALNVACPNNLSNTWAQGPRARQGAVHPTRPQRQPPRRLPPPQTRRRRPRLFLPQRRLFRPQRRRRRRQAVAIAPTPTSRPARPLERTTLTPTTATSTGGSTMMRGAGARARRRSTCATSRAGTPCRTRPTTRARIETYPNTEYDVGGREASTYPSTKAISRVQLDHLHLQRGVPDDGRQFRRRIRLVDRRLDQRDDDLEPVGRDAGLLGTVRRAGTRPGRLRITPIATTLDGVSYHALNLGGEVIFFRRHPGGVRVRRHPRRVRLRGGAGVGGGHRRLPTQLEYGVEIGATTGAQTFASQHRCCNLS